MRVCLRCQVQGACTVRVWSTDVGPLGWLGECLLLLMGHMECVGEE